MVCGKGADGVGVCAAPCTSDPFWFIGKQDRGGFRPITLPGWFCIDGRPADCSATPCGCECPNGTYCDLAAGCVPAATAEEPCPHDLACTSYNCSANAWDPPGVCYVPLGAACNDTNCELCVDGPDRTYCSEECTGKLACDTNTGCDFRYERCMPLCNSDSDCTSPWTCNAMYDFDRVTVVYRVCGPAS